MHPEVHQALNTPVIGYMTCVVSKEGVLGYIRHTASSTTTGAAIADVEALGALPIFILHDLLRHHIERSVENTIAVCFLTALVGTESEFVPVVRMKTDVALVDVAHLLLAGVLFPFLDDPTVLIDFYLWVRLRLGQFLGFSDVLEGPPLELLLTDLGD
jgi:hypothetical protein